MNTEPAENPSRAPRAELRDLRTSVEAKNRPNPRIEAAADAREALANLAKSIAATNTDTRAKNIPTSLRVFEQTAA